LSRLLRVKASHTHVWTILDSTPFIPDFSSVKSVLLSYNSIVLNSSSNIDFLDLTYTGSLLRSCSGWSHATQPMDGQLNGIFVSCMKKGHRKQLHTILISKLSVPTENNLKIFALKTQ